MGNACGKPRNACGLSDITLMDFSQIDKGIILSTSGKQLTNEKISEIIERSKEQIKNNENNSKAHLALGTCLYSIGYYEASEIHLTKSRQLEKLYQSAYLLGLIFLARNDFKESQMYLKLCIEEKPVPCAYIKLGEVLLRRSKFSLARTVIKQGLEYNPENGELMTILGMTYLPTNLEKALKYTKKATRLNPSLFKPYINLAEIKKAQEKYDKAIMYYHRAMERSNNIQLGFAQLLLASLYFEIGNLEKAISYCNESISSNPSLVGVMKTKGFESIIHNKDISNCIENIIGKDFESAISQLKLLYYQDKKNIPICYFLALAYFESDHKHKSKRFYKKVVNLCEENENTQLTKLLLARAETVLFEFALASQNKETMEKVIEESPIIEEKSPIKFEVPEEEEEEEEPLLTIEGSYPNFSESGKSNDKSEDLTPVKDFVKETPRFFPAKKNTSLRQFASSADPEPGNCLLF